MRPRCARHVRMVGANAAYHRCPAPSLLRFLFVLRQNDHCRCHDVLTVLFCFQMHRRAPKVVSAAHAFELCRRHCFGGFDPQARQLRHHTTVSLTSFLRIFQFNNDCPMLGHTSFQPSHIPHRHNHCVCNFVLVSTPSFKSTFGQSSHSLIVRNAFVTPSIFIFTTKFLPPLLTMPHSLCFFCAYRDFLVPYFKVTQACASQSNRISVHKNLPAGISSVRHSRTGTRTLLGRDRVASAWCGGFHAVRLHSFGQEAFSGCHRSKVFQIGRNKAAVM